MLFKKNYNSKTQVALTDKALESMDDEAGAISQMEVYLNSMGAMSASSLAEKTGLEVDEVLDIVKANPDIFRKK